MIFFSTILLKAQDSPETLQLLNKSYKSLYENPDYASQILQNIDQTKASENVRQRVKIILARAYNLKGDYPKSVDQSLEKSLNTPHRTNNSLYADFALAQQYQALRLYKQSIRISQDLVRQIPKIKTQAYIENLAAEIYQLNASNLLVQKKLKETQEELDKSNTLLKNNSEDFLISIENKIYQTSIYIADKQIDKAEETALQIKNLLAKTPQYIFLNAYNLDNLGRISFIKKDYKQSEAYLTQALQLVQNSAYNPLKNRIYEDLSKNYLAIKNEKMYKQYYALYSETYDKLDQNKKEAIRNLMRLNDQYENKRLDDSNNEFFTKATAFAGICILLVSIIWALSFFEKKKTKSLQKQIDFYTKQQEFFKKAQNSGPSTEKPSRSNFKKPTPISKEKENEILSGLEEFEKSEKFLQSDLSLAVLAGQLETNTKYLSEIINKYKEKNYNNYINELRINHIAYLLKTDPAYLNYKISYLAEKSGFSSHSAFTTVFKSVTGISPNTYIQQLLQNKK